MLIDAHAHLGTWPFALHTERSASGLAAHLRAHGISRAVVSHVGAVLAPEPGPSNRTLFAAARRMPTLLPLPIINPALANWREELDACCAAGPIRAVKIVPNFHNYALSAAHLADFTAELRRRRLRLVLQVRLEDERHRYFALRIKGVPVPQLAGFLRKFPTLHPLLLGLYLPEVRELSSVATNFSADTACAEWEQSVASLLETVPASRLFFGTHTPFLNTRAEIDKLRLARISVSARSAIGSGNARRFFHL
jgi:predicted TIM-barrel fold metal-dependent hydrolase